MTDSEPPGDVAARRVTAGMTIPCQADPTRPWRLWASAFERSDKRPAAALKLAAITSGLPSRFALYLATSRTPELVRITLQRYWGPPLMKKQLGYTLMYISPI